MAAVLACGDGAAASYRSAARLHGLLPAGRRGVLDVTVPHRTARQVDGVTVHRSTTLTTTDICRIDGIPCTTVPRTLLDLADTPATTPAELERAIDRAAAIGRLRRNALQDQLARNPNRAGTARLRAALDAREPGRKATESPLEDVFAAFVRAHGLPEPERQVVLELDDGDGPIRADFMWRSARLIVETDGRDTHATREAFENDRLRDQRLMRAGWRVIRVTWRQVTEHAEALATRIRELLA